ncbi:MAG: PhoH family protein [Asticcacaulis sp.]
MTVRQSEFVPLSDGAVSAICGFNNRHLALLEDAFSVLIETPGGGMRVHGEARGRSGIKRILTDLANRADQGADLTEADIRASLSRAARGELASGASGLIPGRRGPILPKTANQAAYLSLLQRCDLTFGLGPAGTGKTFLAAAYGATLLARGEVDRLVITRPAVEAGERLGFLPGDLNEKVDPYLAPIWQALDDLFGAEGVRRRRDKGEIEVAPLAYMRGRTLSNAFVLVDEAQNTSRLQMKMVLTRLGEGARMAVTGDPSQVDLMNPRDSGLSHAVRLLGGLEGVGVARFSSDDVVRHALVARIVKAYDQEHEARLKRQHGSAALAEETDDGN